MPATVEERVHKTRDSLRAEVQRIERELAEKRKLLAMLREIMGKDAPRSAAPRPKQSRGRGKVTVRKGIVKVLQDAGRPLSTPEILRALPGVGAKAKKITVYGAISQMAKAGELKTLPHEGRGNAYVVAGQG